MRVVAETPAACGSGRRSDLPGVYVDAINGLLVATDVYSEQTAKLIEIALKDSLLWKTHVGWRPVADLGSYVEVSYTLLGLGGGVSGEDALIAGAELPAVGGAEKPSYSIGSATHLIGVEAGYLFELDSGLTLRAGMGLSITLDADFQVEARGGVAGREAVERGSKDYLDRVFERWVHPPTFGFAAGYRFL
ncbi:MAG: hypothetical protein R3F60_29425 [bacterium]